MLDYEWNYQYSIFPLLHFIDYEIDCDEAKTTILNKLEEIKRKLKRHNNDMAILCRIRRLRKNFDYYGQSRPVDQLYITLFTPQKLDISGIDRGEFNVLKKKLSTYALLGQCRTILRQNLNNIDALSNFTGLKKYTFINKRYLIERPESLKSQLNTLNNWIDF